MIIRVILILKNLKQIKCNYYFSSYPQTEHSLQHSVASYNQVHQVTSVAIIYSALCVQLLLKKFLALIDKYTGQFYFINLRVVITPVNL